MRRNRGNVRLANAIEKRFQGWTKQQPCCICGSEGGCIGDHMYGSAFRHLKVVIGHRAFLPYCAEHDKVKTNGSPNAHFAAFGKTQAELWLPHNETYQLITGEGASEEEIYSIMDWGK